ncbi:MAG: hypothetical protein AAGB51_12845 [Planctomycetota bacterium]
MILLLRQTAAVFVDAYRELNAKKLFWITLALSGLIVLVFAGVGFDDDGVSFLIWDLGFIPIAADVLSPEIFYKIIFTTFGIGIWLTWIATVLALVSTAQMVPDFVASGTVELWLVRPMSRVRLLATKYLAGLLFVAMQVLAFSGASFFVIGFRGGAWEPGIFLAVPIVVLFFSYLFCIQTLAGLITKSTIASLLTTLLFWFALFLLNTTDIALLQFKLVPEVRQEVIQARIDRQEENTLVLIRSDWREAGVEDWETRVPTQDEYDEKNPLIAPNREELEELLATPNTVAVWHTGIFIAKSLLPKTSETIELLNRNLLSSNELEQLAETFRDDEESDAREPAPNWSDQQIMEESSRRSQIEIRNRSIWWVAGTSVGFEIFVLMLALVIFARRDF